MIRPGLCSVSFRDLDIDEVVARSADASLACIEWAGDVHVAPGDLAAAARARECTRAAGLEIASYGSYLRFDDTDESARTTGGQVLTAARELDAPRVRVWAGSQGSAQTSPDQRRHIVGRMRRFADDAATAGIEVGLEFHGGTLTDEVASTLQLLDEIDRVTVRTYWQPPVGLRTDQALATLRPVLSRSSTIHVFSWWPRTERLPLAERAELWQKVFGMLAREGSDRDALLEFVPDDDPAVLAREARTLRELIDGTQAPSPDEGSVADVSPDDGSADGAAR